MSSPSTFPGGGEDAPLSPEEMIELLSALVESGQITEEEAAMIAEEMLGGGGEEMPPDMAGMGGGGMSPDMGAKVASVFSIVDDKE
jgi:hypothetical protein